MRCFFGVFGSRNGPCVERFFFPLSLRFTITYSRSFLGICSCSHNFMLCRTMVVFNITQGLIQMGQRKFCALCIACLFLRVARDLPQAFHIPKSPLFPRCPYFLFLLLDTLPPLPWPGIHHALRRSTYSASRTVVRGAGHCSFLLF